MATTTVYTLVLDRAAQILGGYEKLREFLNVPSSLMRRWFDGSSPPPAEIFLKLVDIVSEESLSQLVEPMHTSAAKSQAGRYAQAQALDDVSRDTILKKTKLLREAIEKRGIPKQKPLSVSEFMGRTFQLDEAALVLQIALDSAVLATGAQYGTMQLVEEDGLHIIAQHGFEKNFLDYFARVRDAETTCAIAMKEKRRVVVQDVESHPTYRGTPAGIEMLKANVRAVQSTPLLSDSGEVLGVFSTHCDHPCGLAEHDLAILDHIAGRTAYWLQRGLAAIAVPEYQIAHSRLL